MKHQAFHFSTMVLCLLFSLPFVSFAQDSDTSFEKEFKWSDATETKTIHIDVKKGAEEVKMDFEGEITTGALTVAAYDPDGNKVAWFSLIASGAGGSHINISGSTDDDGGSSYHYDSDDEGSGSNSNSNTNTNSNSSGNNTTVTVTTTNEGKSKSKNKAKHKHKNVEKDGKNYSVVSTNSNSKGAKGLMKKQIENPSPGKWKFVITVAGVSGYLEADIEQE